jgi:hypothetical protein
MKHLSVLVIALILSSAAFATQLTVEGVLEARNGKPVLNIGARQIVLSPHDRHVSADLNKLRVGDFLSGYGEYDQASNTLDLQAIETVGLKMLLGRWGTSDGQVFDFRSFNQLIHYSSMLREWVNYAKTFFTQSTPAQQRELNYTLAPDKKSNRWAIFVADKQALLIGYLEFGARTMLLTLIDPGTGHAVSKLELRPLLK